MYRGTPHIDPCLRSVGDVGSGVDEHDHNPSDRSDDERPDNKGPEVLLETLDVGVALGWTRSVDVDDEPALADRCEVGREEKRRRHHTENDSPDAEQPQCEPFHNRKP